MSNTITLYCKPYIKQWLLCHYGSPVKLPRKSHVKTQLLSCLEKSFQPKSYYNIEVYTEQIEIYIGKNAESTFGVSISPKLHKLVHDVFRSQIEHTLYLFIEMELQQDSTIDKAIAEFQTAYGFTEDSFTTDAIRSMYFRYKKNIKTFFPKSATKLTA